MSPIFAKNFSKELDRLEDPFLMATLVGQTWLVQYGFRDCCVSVCRRDAIVNLMLLEMSDFDMILGMDWLALCHSMVDCHEKAVKFIVSGDKAFIFQGDYSKVPNNFISMLSARQLLRKGCQGFLDFVKDMGVDVKDVDSVSVVREIKFGINVLSGT